MLEANCEEGQEPSRFQLENVLEQDPMKGQS